MSPPPPTDDKTKKVETAKPLELSVFKAPDGAKVDEASATKLLGVLNNVDLAPEARAQALFDLHNEIVTAASKADQQRWDDLQAKLEGETRADPVVGGDKLEPALAGIAKLIDKFSLDDKGQPDANAAKELREAFELSGLGSHRRAVRFLTSIAKALAIEGTPVSGSPGSQPRSQAEILFPNQGKAT